MQNIQASNTNPSTPAGHPVHCALWQLEKVIGTKKHSQVNHLMEGCDLHNDWQHIKGQIEKIFQIIFHLLLLLNLLSPGF